MSLQRLTPDQLLAEAEGGTTEVAEGSVVPDSHAIAFMKEECRKLVRGRVTRWRREELDAWIQHPEIYPYYVAECQEFEAELRALGYDIDALCAKASTSS